MQIVKTPAKILTNKARPVKKFDKKLARLVDKMTETLKAARNPEGVGLAAPQVGVLQRLFVMQTNADKKDEKPRYEAFVNPEIIEVGSEKWEVRNRSGKRDDMKEQKAPTQNAEGAHHTSHLSPHTSQILEGCLSIENIWGFPERSSWIKLQYQDISGKKYTQKFTGFPAVIVQHEIDHLNGVLFTHRVLKQKGKGKLYRIEKDEATKEKVLVPLEL